MGKVFAGESPEGASAAVDAAARAAMAAGARGGLLDALAMDGAVRAHAAGRAREALALFASACVVCALACAAGAWLSASGHPGGAVVAGLIALALAFPAIGLGLRFAAWRKAARRRSAEVDAVRAALAGRRAAGLNEASVRTRGHCVCMEASGNGNIQVVGEGNVVNGESAYGARRGDDRLDTPLGRSRGGLARRVADCFERASLEECLFAVVLIYGAFVFALSLVRLAIL